MLEAIIGPIFHQTSNAELEQAGRLVKPKIEIVRTGWEWKPATQYERNLTDTRAIWRHVIEALQGDVYRARIVADKIAAQPQDARQLVVAKRLGFLGMMRAEIQNAGYEQPIYMMRGSESSGRRLEIAHLAEEHPCVILATVADEGVDIPRLDRLHLAWPQKRELTLVQQVGRILRKHPAKTEARVIDYWDDDPMLSAQAKERRRVYYQREWEVLTQTSQLASA